MRPPEEPTRRKPLRSLLGLAAAALLVLLVLAGLQSWRDLTAAQGRRRQLEERIDDARRENLALERWIDRLQEDPATLERLAREQYGLARPDEAIIVLPADPAAAGESPRPANGDSP